MINKSKKMFFKILTASVLVFSLFGNSAYAGCLDVRDYGYHTYSARVIVLREYRILTNTVDVYENGVPVTYYFYAIYQDQIIQCVCGASKTKKQVRVGDYGPEKVYR